jgi:hypothetical protein
MGGMLLIGEEELFGGICRSFGAGICQNTVHSKLAIKTSRRSLSFMSGMFVYYISYTNTAVELEYCRLRGM